MRDFPRQIPFWWSAHPAHEAALDRRRSVFTRLPAPDPAIPWLVKGLPSMVESPPVGVLEGEPTRGWLSHIP
jgi:hypothetical protein